MPVSRPDPGSRERRFEELYAAYHPAVFGYVLRRTDRPEDAADAIAETFLVLWRRLQDVPAGDAIKPWLYGIARRVLANQRRGERRRSALAAALEIDFANRPLPLTASFEAAVGERAQLRDALATLSESDRELLMLEAWEELDCHQIAGVLGCRPGTARTRLHRARRRLEQALTVGDDLASPVAASAAADRVPGQAPTTAAQPATATTKGGC